MADKTGIEWADATWNAIVGCTIVSPGCTNCYAMKMAARIERMLPGSHYAGTTLDHPAGAVWTGKLALAPERILTQPLRWTKPRRIFVNSMGDLFHESVPDAWIDRVFAVMALCPQHIFQVLTKCSRRMRDYCSAPATPDRIDKVMDELAPAHWHTRELEDFGGWPLPNIWLGVSAEDQRRADERVPDLLATPAAVRFVSAEPLLGPISFNRIHENSKTESGGCWDSWESALNGKRFDIWSDGDIDGCPRLDWIIVGGESGPKARPMHPDWARSIRDQCAAAGVPFFFKQWGEWRHAPDRAHFKELIREPWQRVASNLDGVRSAFMVREGKARAGRLLDGREHDAMPEPAP